VGQVDQIFAVLDFDNQQQVGLLLGTVDYNSDEILV
jgi:hypothetical protein